MWKKFAVTMPFAALVFASCGPQSLKDTTTLEESPALTYDQINQQTDSVSLDTLSSTSSATASSQTLSDTEIATYTQKGKMKTLKDFAPIKATQATISTSKGDITFTLYQDKAPLTVANFLDLASKGFYDGIKFHRIIDDFMAQVGDPLTKDDSKKALWGTGGPGYSIADEFGAGLKHDSEGTVSMANAGPNTGGSQIFITYEPTPWLDGKHAIFGKVTQGMDVLRKLEIGDTITKVSYK